jgi:hypothetical protein
MAVAASLGVTVVASVHLAEANGADDVGGRDPARGCDRGGNTGERQ